MSSEARELEQHVRWLQDQLERCEGIGNTVENSIIKESLRDIRDLMRKQNDAFQALAAALERAVQSNQPPPPKPVKTDDNEAPET